MIEIPKDWRMVLRKKRSSWVIFADWLEDKNEQQRAEGWRELYRFNLMPLHHLGTWRWYDWKAGRQTRVVLPWLSFLPYTNKCQCRSCIGSREYGTMVKALDTAACYFQPRLLNGVQQ